MTSPSERGLPEIPSVLQDKGRLDELEKTGLLDEETVENFDRLTRQATEAVGAAAGFVSLITEAGQFLRGCVGFPEPLNSTRRTPIEHSICAYTLDRSEPLVLDDVTDSILGAHPAVEEYGIEAYLGVPLITSTGHVVGTFCLVEWAPRPWTDTDVATAKDFAASARTEIELRLELDRRKELESQLRGRTEAFEALVENLTDVVTVLGPDGTIEFESLSAAEVLGYEPHELEGTSIWDHVHPDDRPELKQKMETALADADGRPAATFRFQHADGDWRILESRGRRLPEEVDLGTFIGVSRDVTERRRLEEQVRLLANAVEHAETGVIITGPNLSRPGPKIQYVNEAMSEMTGYDEAEMLGNTPRMFQGPETNRDKLDRLKRRLSTGNSFIDEAVNYRKDGTPYHVRWRITPITNEDGTVTHFVSVQENITAEKEREKELEQRVEERTRELRAARDDAERANRLKSALLANMSHEIRTPLTSIIGFAEAIEEDVTGQETQDEGGSQALQFARLIEKSGRRLFDTLDGLLNLSKLEAGDVELSLGPVDLAAEAKEMAEEFQMQAEEAGTELRVETPEEPPKARADETILQVALRNLVQNAIKYTEAGEEVELRVREGEEAVVVEVEDTGIGISEESLPHVFEAFEQESKGLSREYEGSGLGLAITKEAVAQMGGTVEVKSIKGEGACFTVFLPRAERAPSGDAL